MPHKKYAAPTLIFLPGWGFQASVWQTTGKQFEDYSVLYYNLPLIQTKPAFLKALHHIGRTLPNNSIIVGWSLGGLAGLLLSYYFPAKCRALITVACTPKFIASDDWSGVDFETAHAYQALFQNKPLVALDTFKKLVSFPHGKRAHALLSKHMLALTPMTQQFYLKLLIQSDLRNITQQLSLPNLHFFGHQDAILPSKLAPQIAKTNASSNTVTIEDAGHAPFVSHQPLFTDHLRNFIEQSYEA